MQEKTIKIVFGSLITLILLITVIGFVVYFRKTWQNKSSENMASQKEQAEEKRENIDANAPLNQEEIEKFFRENEERRQREGVEPMSEEEAAKFFAENDKIRQENGIQPISQEEAEKFFRENEERIKNQSAE